MSLDPFLYNSEHGREDDHTSTLPCVVEDNDPSDSYEDYSEPGEIETLPTVSRHREAQIGSLQMAEDYKYFRSLRLSIMWPDEDIPEFKQMVIGVIIEYLPTNYYNLELLRQIIRIHWALRRLSIAETNIITYGVKGRTGKRPLTSLDSRYSETLQCLPEYQKLMTQLSKAIRLIGKAARNHLLIYLCDHSNLKEILP